MKIALISDIHGNLAALKAVLADATARHVDMTLNLGDILSGALYPRETADLLMPLAMPTIRGNHERQVLERPLERMGLSDRHAATSLRDDQIAWLASLPETLRPLPDLLMVHGTVASDLEYFLETVTGEGLRPATTPEIEARAAGGDAAVIVCGHTHIPRVVRLGDGRLIVTPGIVGLPAYDDDQPYAHVVETGSPHARYAVLTTKNEHWDAELIAVAYDWEQAALDAEANGRYDWARALCTGRI